MAVQAARLDDVTGANPNALESMRAYLSARNAVDLQQWDE